MRRLQTLGLFLALLTVAVLAGSLVAGLGRGGADGAAASSGAGGKTLRTAAPRAERVRVEVLNAAGVPDLARRATRQLRADGFDVVYFGNAPERRDTSVVFDRVGRLAVAARVAEALEIGRVVSAPDSGLYLDVSVYLARDWRP